MFRHFRSITGSSGCCCCWRDRNGPQSYALHGTRADGSIPCTSKVSLCILFKYWLLLHRPILTVFNYLCFNFFANQIITDK